MKNQKIFLKKEKKEKKMRDGTNTYWLLDFVLLNDL